MTFNLNFSQTGSLCEKCKHSLITQTEDQTTDMLCTVTGTYWLPRQPVTDCSDYEFRFRYATFDMERQAWLLETKDRKVVGFKPPTERKRDL